MDNNRPNEIRPSDLVLFVDLEITGGPSTVFHMSLLGEVANGEFAQANEALFRQYSGWEQVYEEHALVFERIAGFRPEAVYEAMAELRQSKGLTPWVDRWRRPLSEGLERISRRRTKEG